MIQARNQYPPEYGQSKKLEFETKKEAPYDLTIEWTLNNDLILRWKHPNVTNGDIQRFDISVFESNSLKTKKELKVNENNCTFEYEFKVEATVFQPSTSYSIEISAYNGYNGKSIKKTDTSPPAIPLLLKSDPKFSSTDNTIHFEISLDKTKILQNNNYTLFLLISGKNTNFERLHPRLEKLAKLSNLINFTLILECNLLNLNSPHSFTIGDGVEVGNCNSNMKNIKLTPATLYNVTILFANHFGDKTSYKIYSFNYQTEQVNLSLLYLLLLLLIPIGIVIYVKRNSIKNIFCNGGNLENQQEELPLSPEEEYQYPLINLLSIRSQINNAENNAEDASSNMETHTKTTKTKSSKELGKNELHNNYWYPRTQSKTADFQNKLETLSKGVLIAEFKKYVEACLNTGEFKRQYDMVFSNPVEPTYQSIQEKQYFGYIDVNINGEEILKAYIAAEIPKPNATASFWKMIWDDHVEHIILLHPYENKTNIDYWPENNENKVCHNIKIQHIFTKISDHFEFRKFTLNDGEELRNVDHLLLRTHHYEGFPTYSEHMLPFFQKILRWPLKPNSPILVHCSDGIEGTGFVILCDMSLRISKKNDQIDVFKNLQKLCDYNAEMINYDYYKLVHLIILEYYFDFEGIGNLSILYENV